MNRHIILNFATKMHEGQFRKNSGLPYITHPITVFEIAEKINIVQRGYWPGDMLYSVAICHDILEDTEATEKDILGVFNEAGLGDWSQRCVESIRRLSRIPKTLDIIPYLKEIKYDGLAKIVKLADLKHNLSDLTPGNLLDKYKLCQDYLKS